MNATDLLSTETIGGGSTCDNTAQYLAIAGGLIALLSEGMGACSHEQCPNGLLDAVRQGLRSPCVAQLLGRRPAAGGGGQDSGLPL